MRRRTPVRARSRSGESGPSSRENAEDKHPRERDVNIDLCSPLTNIGSNIISMKTSWECIQQYTVNGSSAVVEHPIHTLVSAHPAQHHKPV